MNDNWKSLIEAGNEAYERGKIPEAEVKFLAAYEIAKEFSDEDPRLTISLNNLAAIYHEEGKYTMAEPLYVRALELKERLYANKPHIDIATAHHNLAVLYSARRMYPIAEKHYKLAIEMKELLLGTTSPELTNTLKYYAQLMKVLNRHVDKQLLEVRLKEIEAKRSLVKNESSPI